MKVRKLRACPLEDSLTQGCGNIPRQVIEESTGFYIVDVAGGLQAWKRVECEIVPGWADVTAECRVVDAHFNKIGPTSEAGVFHNGKRLAILVCGGTHRVRKVTLTRIRHDQVSNDEVAAFIIEEKADGVS